MNRVLACLAVLASVPAASADDPKPAPGTKAVISGKPSGLVLMRTTTGGKTETVRVRVLKLDDKTAVAVALPEEKDLPRKDAKPGGVDPDLEAALRDAAGESPAVAVTGRLSSTDNVFVVSATGLKGAKAVPLIRADAVTELTDANKKDFPPVGSARVEGVLVPADIKLGSEVAKWAIDGADPGPVPLLLPAEGPVPTAGVKVRATGAVRVVGGQFAVEVMELATVK